jgi:hypothetical protein
MNDHTNALLGLAIFGVIWAGAIVGAAWLFWKKGYSPHYAWFAIVPVVGLIVLAVALLVPVRHAKTGILTAAASPSDPSPLRARYEKGMRELGNGLIGLGVLTGFAAVLVFTGKQDRDPETAVILATFAAAYIVLGWFARRLHAWVNYVVVVLACFDLGASLLTMAKIGQNPQTGLPGSSLGVCLGLIIAAALFYYSINNLQKRSQWRKSVDNGWQKR